MPFDSLAASDVITIREFASVDHFRQAVGCLQADITPLNVTNFAPRQASVTMPDCELVLMRAFPRIIDATLKTENALIMFMMEDGQSTTINGADLSFPAISLARGAAGYKIVERQSRLSVGISFSSPMRDRGWPDVENESRRFRITDDMQTLLRQRVSQVMVIAAAQPEQWRHHGLDDAVQQSLLALLDEAFNLSRPVGFAKTACFRKQFRIASTVDEFIAAHPSEPIYSEDVAKAVGISVRSLHNTMIRWRGTSLHHYLRVRRLWLVRRQLLSGDPSIQVKTCAMQHGFWHLGEFAAAYSSLFGELPSRTLAESRATR